MSREIQKKKKDTSIHKPSYTPGRSGLLKGQSMSQDQPRLDHDLGRAHVYPAVPGTIQAKLTVNQPGDKYEQEADQVTEQVMRMPNPEGSQFGELRREPMEDEDGKGTIQAK